MSIKHPEVSVRLSGIDSNAMVIVGAVRAALRRGKVPPAEIDAFSNEALSGNYDQVIQTALRWVDVT
jgi:hypothetical protein